MENRIHSMPPDHPLAEATVDVRIEKHEVSVSAQDAGQDSDRHLDFLRNTSSSWQLKPSAALRLFTLDSVFSCHREFMFEERRSLLRESY